MNAMQCQFRGEIFATARYRGFHFDSVTIDVEGEDWSVLACCGKAVAVLHISFKWLLDYRYRNAFCIQLCEQIIGPDWVMSKAEIINRRLQGYWMHRYGKNFLAHCSDGDIPAVMVGNPEQLVYI